MQLVVRREGALFLCDVAHSGAAQSGGRASWDTKIGFVLCSPRSALTHSALLPLVTCVLMVNKHILHSEPSACVCASGASYTLASLLQVTKIWGWIPMLLIDCTYLHAASNIQTCICKSHWKPQRIDMHFTLTQTLYGFLSIWRRAARNLELPTHL